MVFAGRVLYRDVNLFVGPHERMGLAGPNGAGKSTLLKVIAGLVEPDGGEIAAGKYVSIGYLPQDGITQKGRTVVQEAQSAFGSLDELKEKLAYYEAQLEALNPDTQADDYNEALEIYGELQHHLDDLDVDRKRAKVERVLTGLGFKRTDFERDCGEFSGGWQMRIALAKLLLEEPSVLLLDEPTNHLDIESVAWLESYLRSYEGAIILVSHDRSLLDSLTRKTAAIRQGKIELYSGNYSYYVEQSAARKEQLILAKKAQDREIEKLKEFIDRFRAKATKAKQVQSRIKQLEKIQVIELENEESEISFSFPSPKPSGQVVFELNGVTKHYGDLEVFEDVNLKVERNDRIGIVGVNGAGKSTLMRIMAGTESITAGECKRGYKVELGYFAQNQAEELDPHQSVLESVGGDNASLGQTKARSLLGCFLFRGDEVFKHVSVLSGGEKNRLALAKMLMEPANTLLLDEPTNHLDMQSQEVLQNALKDFNGTLIIVSHNRSFIDPLVNRVLEIKDRKARLYLGNVSEYLETKRREDGADASADADAVQVQMDKGYAARTVMPTAGHAENGAASSQNGAADNRLTRKEQRQIEGRIRQEKSKRVKPLKDKLQEIEDEIEAIETRFKELEELMADPDFVADKEKVREASEEYREKKARLESLYTQWSEVSDEMERVEKAIELELSASV